MITLEVNVAEVQVLWMLVGGLTTILIALIAYIGNRVIRGQESMQATLLLMQRDLRGELTLLDRRVTVVETKQNHVSGYGNNNSGVMHD